MLLNLAFVACLKRKVQGFQNLKETFLIRKIESKQPSVACGRELYQSSLSDKISQIPFEKCTGQRS